MINLSGCRVRICSKIVHATAGDFFLNTGGLSPLVADGLAGVSIRRMISPEPTVTDQVLIFWQDRGDIRNKFWNGRAQGLYHKLYLG
jgi:hypothetical protein